MSAVFGVLKDDRISKRIFGPKPWELVVNYDKPATEFPILESALEEIKNKQNEL